MNQAGFVLGSRPNWKGSQKPVVAFCTLVHTMPVSSLVWRGVNRKSQLLLHYTLQLLENAQNLSVSSQLQPLSGLKGSYRPGAFPAPAGRGKGASGSVVERKGNNFDDFHLEMAKVKSGAGLGCLIVFGCSIVEGSASIRRAPVSLVSNHPRVDARQSQKSIPRIYRGINVKRQFPLPLT